MFKKNCFKFIYFLKYRLTKRSPIRNPRTPGRRTPLSTLANRGNCTENYSSPKLASNKKEVPVDVCIPTTSKPQTTTYVNSLVQCQLTAKQLNQQEVEEIWKNTTLRQISNILDLSNLNEFCDSTKIKGEIFIKCFFSSLNFFTLLFCFFLSRKMGSLECNSHWS